TELISTVTQHAVSAIHLTIEDQRENLIDTEFFVSGLVDCTADGSLSTTAYDWDGLLNQPRSFWEGMVAKLAQPTRAASYRERISTACSRCDVYEKTFTWKCL
ncbi:hypothetical protein PMAYCL1PPCAC_10185, partial [Pristionchus mayeri]